MVKKILLSLFVVLSVAFGALAQNRQISGSVVDADGAPVIGAAIVVDGTSIGTTSGADGSFSVNAPANGTILVSYIGFETQSVAIAGKTQLKVVLAEDTTALEEVIIVAYGTTSREAFTGSAAVVDSEQIGKIQSSSVLNALEGSTAGVQILSASGQPGANPTVLIRGIGSINASNTPLYIVDGATYEGDISSINSADVESMTVLKDAAASSLYGARGANGVILITTKKGNKSNLGVTFDMKVGVNSRAVKEYDLISDPGQYYELSWLGQVNNLMSTGNTYDEAVALTNGSTENSLSYVLGGYNNYDVAWSDLIGSDGKLNSSANLMYNDNWYDELFSNSVRQEYNVSLGKNEEGQSYFVSLGYLDEDSYAKYSGYQRYTGRIRYEKEVTNWLKFGANLSYAHTDQDYLAGEASSSYRNYFQWVRTIAPIYPVYLHDPTDGSYVLDDSGNKIYDYGAETSYGYSRPYAASSNPAGALNYDVINTTKDAIIGATFMELTLAEGLKLTGNYDTNVNYGKTVEMYNPTYGDGASYGGKIDHESTIRTSSTASSFLTWAKTYDKLSIDVLAGAESYNMSYQYTYASKSTLAATEVYPDFSNAVEITDLTSSTSTYSVVGLLSRVNLGYDDKYYLSASYRRDGSSRFHPDNRWGNFGSVGASWRISQEDFMSSVKWVDDLKLKASYGSQGNDALLDEDGYALYTPYQDQYEIVNNNGAVSTQSKYIGNEDITWEKNHNFNVGVDFSFLDRVTVSAEYFSRVTKDMLFNTPVASSTGVTSIPENIGSMKNYGWEAMVSVDLIKTRELYWNFSANFTHVKNVVLELPDEYKESGISSGYRIIKEGGSIYDYYLPEYAGVDEDGYALYNVYTYDDDGVAEVNTTTIGSNAYTTDSRQFAGSSIPTLQGGFSTSLAYKGFDFSAVFSYQLGGYVYDSVYATSMQLSKYGYGIHADQLDAWSYTNTDSDIPMFRLGDTNANSTSDRFFVSASYLNIRNISLGYTLPTDMFKESGISSLRVYLAGDNLALFSARQGLDPRQYSSGTTTNVYSPIRTVSVGVNLTL